MSAFRHIDRVSQRESLIYLLGTKVLPSTFISEFFCLQPGAICFVDQKKTLPQKKQTLKKEQKGTTFLLL